jgi:hypothetical protein
MEDSRKINLTQSHLEQISSKNGAISLPRSFGKCLGNPLIDEASPPEIRLSTTLPSIEPRGEILLDYAKKSLPSIGVLKVTEEGFIYVDLPDSFIVDLYELLHKPDTFLPPYFDEEKRLCGAHISVVLETENRKALHLPEIDQEIPFSITGCYSASPENWEEVSRVWFLTIDAPILSNIRKKLGLNSKIQGNEFHITFAIQKRIMSIHDILAERASDKDKTIILGTGDVTKNRIRLLRNSRNFC